jgi:hypothetical protein
MFLAMSPDEQMQKLFDQERKRDNLIQLFDADQNILGYNSVAKEAGAAFLKKLPEVPLMFNAAGKVVHMAGMWAEHTCVIAGSGASQDAAFVDTLRKNNAIVIAVGNALPDIAPHLWVGSHEPSSYSMRAYQAPGWISVSPAKHSDKNLWHPVKKEFVETSPSTCPSNLFYNSGKHKVFFDKPHITDFETGSSLMAALSTAVCLGFTNIVLSGVDLGGSVDNYFYFEEVPHKAVVKRKNKAYARVREEFKTFNAGLLERAIRVVSTTDIDLGIPVIPADFLKTFMGSASKVQNAISPGVSAPPEEKKKQAEKTKDRRKALLTALHLWDSLDQLAEELPVFTGPTAEKVRKKLTAALAKGGCSGCAKRRLTNPLMRLFVEEYQKDADKLEDVWLRLFPDHYVMKVGKELVTRSDRA